jgi:cold shock CspA family protein
MPVGFVKRLNVEKKFGFISPGPGEPDVFFHHSVLVRSGEQALVFEKLVEGQPVAYELDEEAKANGTGARAASVARCRPDQAAERGPLAPLRRHQRARKKKPTWRDK